MSLSAAEQYLLELMNRARLDPAGEAARMGIDLNQNLAVGQISTAAKQVLAPNALLEAAATGHSLWMLGADVFSHYETGNVGPDARILAQGYHYSFWGENIALSGTTGAASLQAMIDQMNTGLFLSSEHRVNLMNGGFRELGVGAEAGVFTQNGTDFNAEALTLDFATTGTAHFLTGVAYTDSNADKFYSIGEGVANVVFAASGQSTGTADAGGYSLALGAGAATAVTGHEGTLSFSLTVDMSLGNVKLDLVSGTTFYTSGSVVLGTGVNNVMLLGVGALDASGNAVANVLTGNAGANALTGLGGNDVLIGMAGADTLVGGTGFDRLTGGQGMDAMTGGAGSDTFIFNAGDGVDHITDFSIADHDVLRFNHLMWSGLNLNASQVVTHFLTQSANEAVFDFGNGQVIHLSGMTSHFGIAADIVIF